MGRVLSYDDPGRYPSRPIVTGIFQGIHIPADRHILSP